MLKPSINIENLKPYRAGMSIDEVKRKYNLSNLIKLASNENSYTPSERVVKALQELSKSPYIYPDGNCTELKKVLSAKLNITPENLIIGNGSNEIIELCYRTFLGKGEKVISCSPTFSFYKICCATTNGKYLEVPLKNNTFDLNAIYTKIDSTTKIIIICNPNNPTGTALSLSELENFFKKIPDNILLVIDEAYIEFSKEKYGAIDLIKKFPNKNLLILRTFSKLYGLASLRIGYGIANKTIIEFLNKVRQPFNVNAFAQVAAVEALKDEEHKNKVLNHIANEKIYLYRQFQKLNIPFIESETNFIFFETSEDNDKIFEEFLKRGVIIRSLKSFGYSNALRVTIGTSSENRKFINALQSIVNTVLKECL